MPHHNAPASQIPLMFIGHWAVLISVEYAINELTSTWRAMKGFRDLLRDIVVVVGCATTKLHLKPLSAGVVGNVNTTRSLRVGRLRLPRHRRRGVYCLFFLRQRFGLALGQPLVTVTGVQPNAPQCGIRPTDRRTSLHQVTDMLRGLTR